MEDFSINVRITTKEYLQVMLLGLYKKPLFIIATLYGLFEVTTFLLDYMQVIDYYTNRHLIVLISGVVLLLVPFILALMALLQFKSNPSFSHDLTYTFSNSGFVVKGLTFKSEFLWEHIIKQKEIGDFLIFTHIKSFGHLIDKRTLTADQLAFIKAKVKQK